jgi:hypothetical protein
LGNDWKSSRRLAADLKTKPQGANEMAENTQKSSAAIVLFAWLLVGIQLGWGVYNTLLNSMKLFQNPPAATLQAVPSE